MGPARLKLAAEGVEATPFEIPGATGGTFLVQILNGDAAKGVVTTIVHHPPGGRIPRTSIAPGRRCPTCSKATWSRRARSSAPAPF